MPGNSTRPASAQASSSVAAGYPDSERHKPPGSSKNLALRPGAYPIRRIYSLGSTVSQPIAVAFKITDLRLTYYLPPTSQRFETIRRWLHAAVGNVSGPAYVDSRGRDLEALDNPLRYFRILVNRDAVWLEWYTQLENPLVTVWSAVDALTFGSPHPAHHHNRVATELYPGQLSFRIEAMRWTVRNEIEIYLNANIDDYVPVMTLYVTNPPDSPLSLVPGIRDGLLALPNESRIVVVHRFKMWAVLRHTSGPQKGSIVEDSIPVYRFFEQFRVSYPAANPRGSSWSLHFAPPS